MEEILANQSEQAAPQPDTQQVTAETPKQAAETTPPAADAPKAIRVKYNHQEVEVPYEDAITHIQKGMNYDKAVERAAQEARDKVYADMGYTWNGKPITTEAQYKQALREQEMLDAYKDRGLPDEVVRELVESKKFREEYAAKERALQQRARNEQMYEAFLATYPDVKPNEIPPEVWRQVEQGRHLLDAYVAHENKTLKDKLSKLQGNEANAAASTGSVKGDGKTLGMLTREQVENMSVDEAYKNYALIEASMKHWK